MENSRQEIKEPKFNLKYVRIPIEIFLNKKLRYIDGFVFALIELLDGADNCFASNSYLASVMDVTEITISNSIRRLKAYGFVKLLKFDGRSRVITIDKSYIEKHDEVQTNLLGRLKQTFKRRSVDEDQPSFDKSKEGNRASGDAPHHSSAKNLHPLIRYWNSLPNIQKFNSPDTKTYKKALRLLRQLKSGKFIGANGFDQDFLDKHKISDRWKTKKWNSSEIKTTMLRLSNLLTDGYCSWVNHRERFPKDLSSLMYNPRQGSSMFLMVTQNPPELIVNTQVKDGYPNITEMFTAILTIKPTTKDLNVLIKNIRGLAKYHEIGMGALNDPMCDSVFGYEGFPEKFCGIYAAWVDHRFSDFKITPKMIGIESNTWCDFMDYVEEEYGFRFPNV